MGVTSRRNRPRRYCSSGVIGNFIKRAKLTHLLYILVLLSLIAFTIFGDSGLYQLNKLYQMRRKLIQQSHEHQRGIKQLQAEKIRLVSPKYLEPIIRRELGLIKDGEVVYQITP